MTESGGGKEGFGSSKGKKDAVILKKRPKLQNHFAMCQTLHKSTYGGIQKNRSGT